MIDSLSSKRPFGIRFVLVLLKVDLELIEVMHINLNTILNIVQFLTILSYKHA